MDAFLIAEAHRSEKGVCACGRPLPCIAAERADEIMAETMLAARAAEEAARVAAIAAEEQRRISRSITQELPVLRLPPEPEAPVGARFYRPKQQEQEPPPPPPAPLPLPAPAPAAPTGARFYRERKAPRHRG